MRTRAAFARRPRGGPASTALARQRGAELAVASLELAFGLAPVGEPQREHEDDPEDQGDP
jgi:hypothetical protein